MSEKLFIQNLVQSSIEKKKIKTCKVVDVDRLTGDASTRRYYRVFTKDETYVVCIDNPMDAGENPFVQIQSFLADKKIRVPQIFDKQVSMGYLLEEDLGDTTLLSHLAQVDDVQGEYHIYQQTLDIILDLHKIPQEESKNSGHFSLSFDTEKFMSEIDFSLKYFLGSFLGVKDESLFNSLREMFSPVCDNLSKPKKVITHRDFHSRNIMVKNSEMILIDFQDARWGLPQYDLVSMLEDCYYEIESENKLKLIEYYYNNLPSEIHQQGSLEQFKTLYNDMLIQRVFKAVGSFSYIYDLRSDKRYLKYIAFGMEKIKKVLLANDQHKELRKLLFKHYYEN